ncbi:MerR family transcriptional regulator [Arthrobacter sp. L77]|uniref:MerR family transcriptional regulator n=1 Tax=Arthrobacter sp. L77 TaxID=1496689 RepID=UPI00068EF4EE|nr:MerR family transcriptional regulator [Arthrobacter sp. L77]
MHIGELADRTGLSLRTLRHYDEVGLLRPSGRTDGGFRVYSEGDFTRLTRIRQARALKFSLEEIGELLDVLTARSGYHGLVELDAMETLLAEARRRRTKLAADLERADDLITQLSTSLQHPLRPTVQQPG